MSIGIYRLPSDEQQVAPRYSKENKMEKQEKCYLYTDVSYDKAQVKQILTDFIKVKPGQKVVIKPNWVREGQIDRPQEWEHIITHPVLVEAVAELVVEKLQGKGSLKVMDSPMSNSSFNKAVERGNIREKLLRLNDSGVKVEVLDLRQVRDYMKGDILVSSKPLEGDPAGFVAIDLHQDSLFSDKKNKQYFGADYDVKQLRTLHNEQNNIYHVSKSALEADVFINLPKLKTHRLAGMTGALKNLVGITVMKNSIPHYTIGTPENGGDDYKEKNRKSQFEIGMLDIMRKIWKKKNPFINSLFIPLKRLYAAIADRNDKQSIRGGIWYGNDTVWRAVLDLNRILRYADKNGVMQLTQQREYLVIMDAIYAGENYGPLKADKKVCNTILVGNNPVAVDTVACSIMGYDYKKVPTVWNGYCLDKYALIQAAPQEVTILSNNKQFDGKKPEEISWDTSFQFVPQFGWKDHIELKNSQV